MEQGVNVKFCFTLEKSTTETYKMTYNAYNTPSEKFILLKQFSAKKHAVLIETPPASLVLSISVSPGLFFIFQVKLKMKVQRYETM